MYRTFIHQIVTTATLATLMTACCVCPTDPCDDDPGSGGGGGERLSGEVCVWVSSDKDTYASRGRQGEEGNLNFGQYGQLVVANGPLGIKQTYVHFTPPSFPAGTEIVEAKLELYHSGRNEDGSSDDIRLSVAPVRNESWSPMQLTWNNRPDRGGLPALESEIHLRSQAWSGTPDIAPIVRRMIAAPSEHHGFMIWYRDASERQIEKGFYSNNERERTASNLARAPRLVLKVRLPQGTSVSSATLAPTLVADNDLDFDGEAVTMVRTRQGSQWPADWNVSP